MIAASRATLGLVALVATSVLCGTLLTFHSAPAAAQPIQSNQSVDVSAKVCDEQNTAPIITTPSSGSTHQSSVVRFEGTAGANRIVTVLRNNLHAGTVLADSTGRWQLQLTLVQGTNTVIAKDCYDSAPITVFYAPASPPPPDQPGDRPALQPAPPNGQPGPGTSNGQSGPNGQFSNEQPGSSGQAGSNGQALQPASRIQNTLEAVQAVPRGSFFLTVDTDIYNLRAGESSQFSATINGGNGPFVVRWDWGDGSSTEQRLDQRAVMNTHKYESSGTYQIQITATDRDGRQAAISSVAKVSPVDGGAGVTSEPSGWISWVGVVLGILATALLLAWLLHRRRHHQARLT